MKNEQVKKEDIKKEDKKEELPFGIYEAPTNIPENTSGKLKIIME